MPIYSEPIEPFHIRQFNNPYRIAPISDSLVLLTIAQTTLGHAEIFVNTVHVGTMGAPPIEAHAGYPTALVPLNIDDFWEVQAPAEYAELCVLTSTYFHIGIR
jgi:hypothetical protein